MLVELIIIAIAQGIGGFNGSRAALSPGECVRCHVLISRMGGAGTGDELLNQRKQH